MKADGQCYAPAALPPGKRLGIHYTGSWVGTRAGLHGYGKSRPTGIRSTDHRVRSESLYRMSYPSPPFQQTTSVFMLISFVQGNINADIHSENAWFVTDIVRTPCSGSTEYNNVVPDSIYNRRRQTQAT